jgi:hypothetical protein
LANDNDERTVWHIAAERGNLDVLHKLWDWAKEVLTPQDLKEMFFLAKGEHESTVWHITVKQGNLDILYKL